MVVIYLGAIPPQEIRGNSRSHWAKKNRARSDWRESGRAHGMVDCSTLLGSEKISIQFHFHHNRLIDLDNLCIGMKPWVDGLVDKGVVPDDSPEHVVYEKAEFSKCKKGESRTVVTIERIK
jgi:crossover junction endodeoxyribonuclease RusA